MLDNVRNTGAWILTFATCVCVCVHLLYSHQLGSQRSPLSTTSGGNFVPSTQLTLVVRADHNQNLK